MYISQSTIEKEDKWSLQSVTPREETFFEIDSQSLPWEEDFDVENPKFASIFFRVATKKRSNTKEPYLILDLLGDMGGLLDITMAFGTLVTFSYVKSSFNRSLLSNTYQVQEYAYDNSEYYVSMKARSCMK